MSISDLCLKSMASGQCVQVDQDNNVIGGGMIGDSNGGINEVFEEEDSKHLTIETESSEIVEHNDNNNDYISYDHNYASSCIKTEVEDIKIEDDEEDNLKDKNHNQNGWNYNSNDAWSNLAQLADISLTAAGHIDRPDLASHIKAARSLKRGDNQAGQEILEDIVKTVVGEDENKVVFISEDQLSSILEPSQTKPPQVTNTKPTTRNQYILPRPDPGSGFFQPNQITTKPNSGFFQPNPTTSKPNSGFFQPNQTNNIQISVPTNATHILICTAPAGGQTNNSGAICPPNSGILNLLTPRPPSLQPNQMVEKAASEQLDIELPDRRRTQVGKECRAEYRCYICGKHYSTSSNLARHRQTHRSPEDSKARRCGECGKVYVSMPAFSMHVRTHAAGCVCPHCGKVFSRPWLLKGHLRTHTGERPYKCPLCGKAFSDKSNLRAHVQTHSGSKPFPCGKCGKSFALRSYLVKHEESACGKNSGNFLVKRIIQSTPLQYNNDDTKDTNDDMEEGEIMNDDVDTGDDEDENSKDEEDANDDYEHSSNKHNSIDSDGGRNVL